MEVVIDKALGAGIRPKRDMARNPNYCRDMFNMLPFGERGARTLRQVTYPIDPTDLTLSMSWPFPQILRDEKIVKLFEAAAIWDVDTSSYPWQATVRSAYAALEAIPHRFNDASSWTVPGGWAIASEVATATGATSNDLARAGILTGSAVYLISFSMTRSAGSVTPTFGTTAGTTRSATGTYVEEVTANGTDFSFNAAGFTGTVYDVKIVRKATISSGTAWQFVAFQSNIWFATNGADFVFRLPSNPLDATSADILQTFGSALTVGAVGKHRNALVIGGMAGSQLAAATVTALFAHWRSVQTQNQVTTEDDTLDSTYIMYSEMAGAEMDQPFSVFLAALGYPGAYESELYQGVVYSRVEQGLIGFYRPRIAGAIRVLKPLGDDLMCYGANGVCRLTRGENGYSESPVIDQDGNVVDQGIPSRSAVCGTDGMHYFVSNRGDLYQVTGQGARRLDYSEKLEGLTGTSIVATFDPVRNVHFFSDGTNCYAYTGYGLGQSDAVQPSSLLRLDSSDSLLGTAITKNDPQIARIVGPIVAAPNRQTQEVSSLDIHCQESDATSWTGTADWRMRSSDQFRRPTAIDVPDRGRCFVKKTGVDHRPVLIAPNYKEVDCDTVVLNYNIGKPAIANIQSGADSILSESPI